MIEEKQLKLLQQQLYRLLKQVDQENEPTAFYGLRLAWESLQLAQGMGQFQQVTRAFDEMRLGLEPIQPSSALLRVGTEQPATPVTEKQVLAHPLHLARPAGERDEISVELWADLDNYLVLQVADNGVGLPRQSPDFPPATMGLQLVYLLAQNMQGTVDVEQNNGVIFTIRFKSSEEK